MRMQARLRGALVVVAAMVPGAAGAQPAGAPDVSPESAAGAPADAAPAVEPVERPADPSGGAPPAVVGPPPAAGPAPCTAGCEAPAAAPRFVWQPFGYLRVQYLAVQSDPNVAFVGRDDGFELQNARLGVRGTLDDRVAFVVALDGAVEERLQVNTPDAKLRVGLRDAFADVGLGRELAVRGGFFHAWVDPEALVPDTARALVDKPIESRGMRATEGYQAAGLTPGRSLGVAIRREPEAPEHGVGVGFELAVQNGADELSSNNDNDKPAVSATLLARLPRDSWLMVAGRWNPRSAGDLPFRQDEADLQATAGLHARVGPLSLGAAGIVQRTSFATTGGPAQNAFGGHGQLMVRIPAPLPIAVGYRFGVLDPSSLITTDRVMEHTAGAVLEMPGYRMRVQLQVTHTIEQAARALSNDRAQLAAELAL